MAIPFDRFLVELGAKPSGSNQQEWSAPCPVPGHGNGRGDRNPSFSIGLRNGRVLVRCHARCPQDAVIEALCDRKPPLWPVLTDDDMAREARIEEIAAERELSSGLLKFDSHLIRGEERDPDHYLRSRGINIRELEDVQFHPSAKHTPTDSWRPCMVCAVRDTDNELRGLHRTFLTFDTPPQRIKRRLWYPGGQYAGNSIHLAPAAPKMLIAEGVESCASAMKLLGLPGWAAGGDEFLPLIKLPDIVTSIVIAADNDKPGMDAAIAAAQRYRREGREVSVVKPGKVGDFNDLLLLERGPLAPLAVQMTEERRR